MKKKTKRSEKMKLNIQFRKEWIKPVILAVLLLLLVILAGSCACGKKKDKTGRSRPGGLKDQHYSVSYAYRGTGAGEQKSGFHKRKCDHGK